MKESILLLLFVAIFVSIIMNVNHDRIIHVLFPIHISLALITLYISINWFTANQELLFDYGSAWDTIEKGTLEALSSAVGIVGVSSILLGWAYSDRDNVTLGKRQIEMIHHKLGYGYALSLITHFAATALCILMLKCSAREATLWAFITVLWGCIPQAIICLYIAFNRENREKIALELWGKDCAEKTKAFSTVHEMVGYLSDVNVRHNKKYINLLGSAIAVWLHSCYDANRKDFGASAENIRKVSIIYREISENIPVQEQELFEEDILKSIVRQMDTTEEKEEKGLVLLSCGYYRFLYGKSQSEIRRRINMAAYYSQEQDTTFKLFWKFLCDYDDGLEWYQFLNQRRGVPEYSAKEEKRKPYIGIAFEQLLLSIFEEDRRGVQRDAGISWKQMYPEGE